MSLNPDGTWDYSTPGSTGYNVPKFVYNVSRLFAGIYVCIRGLRCTAQGRENMIKRECSLTYTHIYTCMGDRTLQAVISGWYPSAPDSRGFWTRIRFRNTVRMWSLRWVVIFPRLVVTWSCSRINHFWENACGCWVLDGKYVIDLWEEFGYWRYVCIVHPTPNVNCIDHHLQVVCCTCTYQNQRHMARE